MAWVPVFNLIGPTGAQGPEGHASNTGATGSIGPTGQTGPQGPEGHASNTGATGPMGPTGLQGPRGETFTTLTGYNGTVTIVTPTSFTIFNDSQVRTLEKLNPTYEGLYLQTTVPAISGGNRIWIGIDSYNSAGYKFELNGTTWKAIQWSTTIATGTYSAGDTFSIYTDSQTVYFYINGSYKGQTNFDTGYSYGYLCRHFSVGSDATYSFNNVRFYPTGKIGPTGPFGVSTARLIAATGIVTITSSDSLDVQISDTGNSFGSAYTLLNTQSQGVYAQAIIPAIITGSSDTLAMNIVDGATNTGFGAIFLFVESEGNPTWQAISSDIVIASGTYTDGELFSVYIDSPNVYFYKAGSVVAQSTLPSDFICQYTIGCGQNTSGNTYSFTNISFYATGKSGPTGPAGTNGGTSDVSRWAEYPASTGPVDFNSQDISNVNSLSASLINGYSVSDIVNLGRCFFQHNADHPSTFTITPTNSYYSGVFVDKVPSSPLGTMFSGQATIYIYDSTISIFQANDTHAYLSFAVVTGDSQEHVLTQASNRIYISNTSSNELFNGDLNSTVTFPFYYDGTIHTGTYDMNNPPIFVQIGLTTNDPDDSITFETIYATMILDVSRTAFISG